MVAANRVVGKIEISRRDGKSNKGDFLIFVFLMLVKLSYARSEKPTHLLDGEMGRLRAYFDNLAGKTWLAFMAEYFVAKV